jgi:hypothetical protein
MVERDGDRVVFVSGLLLGQVGRCELAQLVIDERQQLGRRERVAGLDGG